MSEDSNFLNGKKVICIGERDGIPAPAIAECVINGRGRADPCPYAMFRLNGSRAMDLEDQATIRKVVDRHGKDGVIVVLGSPDADSAGIYVETVTTGDPTFAGPLAGTALMLPVYHILEDRIKELIDPKTYEEQVGMMEFVLDKESILKAWMHTGQVLIYIIPES